MSHVKMTLSCPVGLGEQVVEALLESERLTSGFTTFPASGHGHDFTTASLREKVRGRVDTMLIVIVIPAADAHALLAELRERFPTPRLVYWTEPVHAFGDFG
jgi:hypothetical protein